MFNPFSIVGSALGTGAKSMAQNRANKLAASQTQDQIVNGRMAQDRAERDDAWKKIQQAMYMQYRQPYQPITTQGVGQPGGRFSAPASVLPNFGTTNPVSPNDPALLDTARGLQHEVGQRLINGPQERPLSDIDKLTKMGGWEKFLNFAAPILGAVGAYKSNRTAGGGQSPAMYSSDENE